MTRTLHRKALWASIAWLLLVSCKGQNQEATVRQEPVAAHSVTQPVASAAALPAVNAQATEPFLVKVLAPGAEPRRKLRYQYKQGHRQQLALIQQNAITMTVGQERMPPTEVPAIKTVMQWDVSHTEGTTARLDFKVLSAQIDGKAEASVASQMNSMLADFKAFKGHQTSDSRGMLLDFALDTGGVENPQLKQVFESLKQSLGQLTAPLPEEAVGLGAKWQLTSQLNQFGLRVTQTATYSLTAKDERGVNADIVLEQSAPAGKIAPPGMPEGVTLDLLKLTSTGQGKTRIDFQNFVAKSDLDVTVGMKMRVPEGPNVPPGGQTMEMDMRIQMKVVPR